MNASATTTTEPAPESTPTAITYDLDDYHGTASGGTIRLYLDPEEMLIYNLCAYGAEWPLSVHQRIHIGLGSVPQSTVAESLESWLRDHDAQLKAIAACYLGILWDGSNNVGVWADKTDELQHELESLLDESMTYEFVASFWDAAEYFAPETTRTTRTLDDTIAGHESIASAAASYVAEARIDGQWLELDDTVSALTMLLELEIDELETEKRENGLDDDQSKRLLQARLLVAEAS